jgi:phosphoribosyl-AMP cyclohydrolase
MSEFKIDFQKMNGLIPAIIQDQKSKEVYMLGFMSEESFTKTKETGYVWFFSRTRNRLWMKGESSGDKLRVKEIRIDCDNDSILILVELEGESVCHTGNKSCFYRKLK